MTRIAPSLALAFLPAVAGAQPPAPPLDEAMTCLDHTHRVVQA